MNVIRANWPSRIRPNSSAVVKVCPENHVKKRGKLNSGPVAIGHKASQLKYLGNQRPIDEYGNMLFVALYFELADFS